ncbi:hypothetical protein AQUCO_00100740v1 [Aquilegia coerulea]|uniref:Uncharacterized protein n=1 Tax=Aquilegia coerulea TaxID=218851 RepID=A0A2G5FBR7_AQUCA|nr:hypothetical protein AQUCO_00100740v1 [Aquilegia coerulea]
MSSNRTSPNYLISKNSTICREINHFVYIEQNVVSGRIPTIKNQCQTLIPCVSMVKSSFTKLLSISYTRKGLFFFILRYSPAFSLYYKMTINFPTC